MINEKEQTILDKIYVGEITLIEGASELDISLDDLSDLMDENPWFPSSEKIEELMDLQEEYLSEFKSQPFSIIYQYNQTTTKKFDIFYNNEIPESISFSVDLTILNIPSKVGLLQEKNVRNVYYECYGNYPLSQLGEKSYYEN